MTPSSAAVPPPTAAPPAKPAPNVKPPASTKPAPVPNLPGSRVGPSFLEGLAGSLGSKAGVILHLKAVDTLADDIEMIHDPGSPRLGPVGTKRTDSLGDVWIKTGEANWILLEELRNLG